MIAALHALLVLGVVWNAVRPGVWQVEIPMAESGALSVVRAVAIRLDPARLRFELNRATRDQGLRGAWTVDSVPASAIVAFNAGQFTGGYPWGWLVQDGIETQPPGTGSLAMSFVIDSAGRASLVTPDELAAVRGHVQLAFQSYPALLIGERELPWELQGEGRGVDLDHRDSRLALCMLEDGSVAVAITRFAGMAGKAETLPWGPTVGEMADFMRSLGCIRAMLLDGGISSQLAVRTGDGELVRWRNWRAVPLGLVIMPRAADLETGPAANGVRRRSPR